MLFATASRGGVVLRNGAPIYDLEPDSLMNHLRDYGFEYFFLTRLMAR